MNGSPPAQEDLSVDRATAPVAGGRACPAFTLVELILVMALLVVMLAVAAPSLSRSFLQRNLDQQSARLLSLTEYARDEAASQGVPMMVWIDPDTRRFGVDAHAGYTANAARVKEYLLPEDLAFEPIDGAQASKTEGHGLDVAEFAPDGTLDPGSAAAIRISGRNRADTASISQTADGYGYEIVKGGAHP